MALQNLHTLLTLRLKLFPLLAILAAVKLQSYRYMAKMVEYAALTVMDAIHSHQEIQPNSSRINYQSDFFNAGFVVTVLLCSLIPNVLSRQELH